jgi:hypothetical protein
MISGFLGVIVLIADIWAWITIIKGKATVENKVLWSLLIFVLPVIGWIVWYIFSYQKS